MQCIYAKWVEQIKRKRCIYKSLCILKNPEVFFWHHQLKTTMGNKTWHDKHQENLKMSDRIADSVANGMGSWRFIILQSVFVVIWMTLNVAGIVAHWDVYPFILLNLIFSTQAAYAAPIIMMSQNRQSQRDRIQAQEDYQTNIEAKKEIEALQLQISNLEIKKLDKILAMLEEMKKDNTK
jgi:uncharacterized membrane protein